MAELALEIPRFPALAARLQRCQPFRDSLLLTVLGIASPAAGLLVEIVLAHRFGASAAIDAYRICAVMILFAQQALMAQLLPTVLVPVFARAAAAGAIGQAWAFTYSLALASLAGSALLVACIWRWPGLILSVLAPAASHTVKTDAAVVTLHAGIAMGLLSLSAVIGGMLNAHRVYYAAQAGQMAGNLMFAAFLLAAASSARSLALGISLSAATVLAVHLACAIPVWRRRVDHARPVSHTREWNLWRQVIPVAAPALLILAAQQVTSVFNNRALASGATGEVAEFGYAWKMLIVVALIPFSVTTVYYPILARDSAERDWPAVTARVKRLLGLTGAVSAVCAAALLAVHAPLTALLLRHGRMTGEAAGRISAVLAILLLGAPPNVLQVVCGRICLATGTAWPLTVAAVACAAATLAAGAVHARWGLLGVAGLSSAVSWMGGLAMAVLLMKALDSRTTPVGTVSAALLVEQEP